MKRALLLLLCSCMPGAVGPKFRGAPLFTVQGQLVTTGAIPSVPLRLAVAWYPDEQSSTAPRAIVTQDIAYQGTFPLNYSFSFFSVPPPGVLIDYRNGDEVTRAAFGVLLAYEDVNGNGQLDSIASGGSAIDRVLGTSVGDTYNGNPALKPVWVAYVDGTPGQRWVGYSPGYNLWSANVVIPETTSVPIELAATNELNFFVCEEFISGSAYGYDLPCNIAPTGGVRVIGNIYRQNGVPGVALRITDGVNVLPAVRAELNGGDIPFDTMSGLFTASGSVVVVTPGVNVVRVTPPGRPSFEFSVEAPGEFTLQSPREGARMSKSGAITAEWTPSARASFYQVQAYAVTPPNEGTEPVIVSDFGERLFSARVTGLKRVDTHEVAVSAFSRNYLAHGRGGSLVNISTSRSEYVDVLADDIGPWLEGSVSFSTYQGQSGGSAYVQAFDGLSLLDGALVTAEGEPLTWDARNQQYGGVAQVMPGDTVTLGLTAPGKPRKTFPVTLPGAFTLTAPPLMHPTRTPLTLTWTKAPDATDYRVFVADATGRQLHFEFVFENTAIVPALDVVGEVSITVAAGRVDGTRHLVGLVQHTVDVTLTP